METVKNNEIYKFIYIYMYMIHRELPLGLRKLLGINNWLRK